MSLINVMLMDLERRNHQPDIRVIKHTWSIRFKGVMLIVLLAGFAFGSTALDRTAQTLNQSSLKKADVNEFQQPDVGVNSKLDTDAYTDQKESTSTTAPIMSLPKYSKPNPSAATVNNTVTVSQRSPTAITTTELHPAQKNNQYPVVALLPTHQRAPKSVNTTPTKINESYPRSAKADVNTPQHPPIVIKEANFRSVPSPKQNNLEKSIYPNLTLSALNEVSSPSAILQASENTSRNTIKSDLVSSLKKHPRPITTKAKAAITVAHPPSSNNTVESNDIASIEVIHRPLSADQLYQRDFRIAANAYKQGNYSEAERLLENLLAQDNAQHKARLLLAKLYAQQNLDQRAESILFNGLLHYPQHAPYLSLYAQMLAKQGRDSAAIDVLQNALPDTRDNAGLHALLAGLYLRTGNSKAASKSYFLALGLEPTHGEWWMGLGISSEQAGDRNTAEDAYNKALQYPLTSAVEQYAEQRLQQLATKKQPAKVN